MIQETLPYVKHSDTSKAAAESMREDAGTLRHKLYSWLYDNGPATDEEAQLGIPMSPNTQRPRRRELQQAGLVYDTGERRKTKSGRRAVVWSIK
jgi:hypothetical protein